MRSALIAPGRDFLKSGGRNRPLGGSTAGRTLIQLTPQISGTRRPMAWRRTFERNRGFGHDVCAK